MVNIIRSHKFPTHFCVFCTFVFTIAISGELALSAEPSISHTESRFEILKEKGIYSQKAGMAMVCPAHAHGTPEEAYKKLQNILITWPKGKTSSIWVCRANQIKTLEKFSPLADRIFTNPVVHDSAISPGKKDKIWPYADHPILNQIRQIRTKAADKKLIACINMAGEPKRFQKRKASYEEIEWLVLATVGGNFQGIVWRGNPDALPCRSRLKHLEAGLMNYSVPLGAATPVRWAHASQNVPISVLKSKRFLFVVLLNPAYLCDVGFAKAPKLPLSDDPVKVDVCLDTPTNCKIVSAITLDGQTVPFQMDQNTVKLSPSFHGGGEILILKYQEKNKTAENQKSTSKKKKKDQT